ncbi:MAG: hypothetical protein Tsb005_15580 [Gammaproteobacteria bacterium]
MKFNSENYRDYLTKIKDGKISKIELERNLRENAFSELDISQQKTMIDKLQNIDRTITVKAYPNIMHVDFRQQKMFGTNEVVYDKAYKNPKVLGFFAFEKENIDRQTLQKTRQDYMAKHATLDQESEKSKSEVKSIKYTIKNKVFPDKLSIGENVYD